MATTWLISFEQIRQRDPLAAEYLSFMACVDPKDISRSLLPPGLSRTKETDAIGTLDAYSFIVRRSADEALDIHRLVHLAMRNWLREQKLIAQWTEKSISRLEEVFPDHDYRNRNMWRIYLPHIQYTLTSNVADQDSANRTELVWRFGMCLYSDGRYNEAEGQFAEIFEMRKRQLGADHLDTLSSMANLASTYRNRGRWDEAEKLEIQVMETRKMKLGTDHPDTLSSTNNLAFTWKALDKAEEALTLLEECVKRQKSCLCVNYPNTQSSLSALKQWREEDASSR